MDIDLSQYKLTTAVDYRLKTGLATTVGNVDLSFPDTLERVYGLTIQYKTIPIRTSDFSVQGWLVGRRPTYGQMYPRGAG
jgi:hypothetical protein